MRISEKCEVMSGFLIGERVYLRPLAARVRSCNPALRIAGVSETQYPIPPDDLGGHEESQAVMDQEDVKRLDEDDNRQKYPLPVFRGDVHLGVVVLAPFGVGRFRHLADWRRLVTGVDHTGEYPGCFWACCRSVLLSQDATWQRRYPPIPARFDGFSLGLEGVAGAYCGVWRECLARVVPA